jgi:hypothetical protein
VGSLAEWSAPEEEPKRLAGRNLGAGPRRLNSHKGIEPMRFGDGVKGPRGQPRRPMTTGLRPTLARFKVKREQRAHRENGGLRNSHVSQKKV